MHKISEATDEFALCQQPLAVAAPCLGVHEGGRGGSETRACVYERVLGEGEGHESEAERGGLDGSVGSHRCATREERYRGESQLESGGCERRGGPSLR